MVIAGIKKTGSKEYFQKIEATKEGFITYLGEKFDEIPIDHTFSERNIVVIANPLSFETGLEPNLFVLSLDNEVYCDRIIFGNCLFLKRVNGEYLDLTDDDLAFVKEYCDKADMTEDDKAMAGLFEYTPREVGYRFNKKNTK